MLKPLLPLPVNIQTCPFSSPLAEAIASNDTTYRVIHFCLAQEYRHKLFLSCGNFHDLEALHTKSEEKKKKKQKIQPTNQANKQTKKTLEEKRRENKY